MFYSYSSRFKIGKGKHCSKKCLSIFKTGKPSWNKGKPYPQVTGDKNSNWQGIKVGYDGIHHWVRFHKGKPKVCILCKITDNEKRLHWANINHKYQRNIDDYISLCPACHTKYDLKNNTKLGQRCI